MLIVLASIPILLALNFASDLVLDALGQANHVQAGFEGFTVVMDTPAKTAFALALAGIAEIVAAPFAEELVMRGLVFGGLASRVGIVPAALVSGILFGALHVDVFAFGPLAAEGCILALAYARSGNLLVPIALHATMNAIAFWPTVTEAFGPH